MQACLWEGKVAKIGLCYKRCIDYKTILQDISEKIEERNREKKGGRKKIQKMTSKSSMWVRPGSV